MEKELVYALLYETYMQLLKEKNEKEEIPEEFNMIPLDEKIKVLNKAISSNKKIEYKKNEEND